MLRPPWSHGNVGPAIMAAAIAGVLTCLLIFFQVVRLFQNLYLSSFIWLPGPKVAPTYWASVSFGLSMAVLSGALIALLLAVAVLELVRFARRWP
jgi:hypothetical protein